jgi:L-rhamnose mutarotase
MPMSTNAPVVNDCKRVGSYYVKCVHDITKLNQGDIIYIIHNYQNNQETTKYDLNPNLEGSTEVIYASSEVVNGVKQLNYNTTDNNGTNKNQSWSIDTSKITTPSDIKQYSIYMDCPYDKKENFNYAEIYGKKFIAIRNPSQFKREDKIYILNNKDKTESVNWESINGYSFISYDTSVGLTASADVDSKILIIPPDELTTDNAKANIKKYSLYVDTLKQQIKTFNERDCGGENFKTLLETKKVVIRLPDKVSVLPFKKPEFNLNKGDILYIVFNEVTNNFFLNKYKEDPEFKTCYKMQFLGLNEDDKTYMFISLGQNLWNAEQNLIKLDPSKITVDKNNLKQYTLYVDAPAEENVGATLDGGRGTRKRRSKKSKNLKKSRRPRRPRRPRKTRR